jgi:hypothetical protein
MRTARGSASRRVLVLISIVLFCAGVGYGVLASRHRLFPLPELGRLRRVASSTRGSGPAVPAGRWRAAPGGAGGPTEDVAREIERLTALGYVSGSRPAGARSGVTVHERDLAFRGLNFLTSGHAPAALLVDMDGEVLHEWARSFEDVWPGRVVPEDAEGKGYWRRAHLFENGDVLAIYEGLGLVKLDARSEILWSYDGLCHHDLFVTDGGLIYVLEREAKLDARFPADRPILEDYVTVLTPDGEPLRRVSLLSALWHSPYASLVRRAPAGGDIFHTNTLELLDGRLAAGSPAFRSGNVLVSILMLDAIAVVDLDVGEVVWAMSGLWRQQHQPTVLDDGRMLVFDNEFDNAAGERVSRVLEIDPFTQEIHWVYEGGPDRPFYTSTCGSNQRLPNGNTLLTESDAGRAFEVTRDGAIVWEYVSPYRAGEEDELVATLFEVVRLAPDFPLHWLEDLEWSTVGFRSP